MMNLRQNCAVGFFLYFLGELSPSLVEAQTPKVVWNSHAEIREWMAISDIPKEGLAGIENLTEEGPRDFVRINYAQFNANAVFAVPTHNWGFDDLAQLPTVLDPEEHNAVKLTLRLTNLDTVGGSWFHREGIYDENERMWPSFEPVTVPQSQWTEVTLKLTESPFLQAASDVVVIGLGFSHSKVSERDTVNEWRALRGLGAVLDIDRIDIVHVPAEPVTSPTIATFSPRAAKSGELVTIEGSGFAQPHSKNAVFFGGLAEIVSGDATHLVVRPQGFGTVDVRVLIPGGGQSVSDETFRFIGEPRQVTVESGENQSAVVGSTLQPFVIRVTDLSDGGVPGRSVTFRVKEGAGQLSVTQAETDEDGRVSTVLTLGQTPGTVTVEFAVHGFKPRLITATALPQ